MDKLTVTLLAEFGVSVPFVAETLSQTEVLTSDQSRLDELALVSE